jgi:hypothetical protein
MMIPRNKSLVQDCSAILKEFLERRMACGVAMEDVDDD